MKAKTLSDFFEVDRFGRWVVLGRHEDRMLTLESRGFSGQEWLAHFRKRRIHVSKKAREMLIHPSYDRERLPSGLEYKVVLRPASKFAEGSVLGEDEHSKPFWGTLKKGIQRFRGPVPGGMYAGMNAEFVPLILDAALDQNQLSDWKCDGLGIVVMHRPIRSHVLRATWHLPMGSEDGCSLRRCDCFEGSRRKDGPSSYEQLVLDAVSVNQLKATSGLYSSDYMPAIPIPV